MTTTLAPPIYRTSIGKKVMMAVSGVVLLGFVFAHMVGNLKLFLGRNPLNAYADFLRRMGEPIFPRTLLLWGLRTVITVAFVVHIVCAVQLSIQSRRARQLRYAHADHVQANVPSVTMRWGGLTILLFLIFHLANFTWGQIHPGYTYVRSDVYDNVIQNFKVWWITVLYVAAMVALALHLYHGTWSMFQTFGWNNARWDTIIRRTATTLSLVIFLGYISVPLAVLAGYK
jgi:succinate dehydrogenase / fumarate reductase cytochrome b subunit